jgi:hypothetical protein
MKMMSRKHFKMIEEYNGWTNYETWLLALNLDNSQDMQLATHEAALMAGDSDEFKELISDISFLEEHGIYKIEDVWTERDWQEANWFELWDHFRIDAKELLKFEACSIEA